MICAARRFSVEGLHAKKEREQRLRGVVALVDVIVLRYQPARTPEPIRA